MKKGTFTYVDVRLFKLSVLVLEENYESDEDEGEEEEGGRREPVLVDESVHEDRDVR